MASRRKEVITTGSWETKWTVLRQCYDSVTTVLRQRAMDGTSRLAQLAQLAPARLRKVAQVDQVGAWQKLCGPHRFHRFHRNPLRCHHGVIIMFHRRVPLWSMMSLWCQMSGVPSPKRPIASPWSCAVSSHIRTWSCTWPWTIENHRPSGPVRRLPRCRTCRTCRTCRGDFRLVNKHRCDLIDLQTCPARQNLERLQPWNRHTETPSNLTILTWDLEP